MFKVDLFFSRIVTIVVAMILLISKNRIVFTFICDRVVNLLGIWIVEVSYHS
jgi:hypothetical protein